ncbi:CRISPR-associated protein Cas4 [Venenivibrio stagnispumantis]|uniref:CRISPR-associated exonuclease Cas4 n=1 Tax=Venenivibrio stagnispumantis TaxID=407998 RepID=A0AA46AFE6_9AQUI|nr:CRISPR-associated protein Cas4 [Venenivibrio stagnispumantis]MCW4573790.1 CRISPR-associated protein Cas4 [Venenivibrio stagnispumantis]SMP20315.1 CRISPR-associated exonuclease, Cas4 family [Venenivibrio stagnispumantis]
MEDLEKINGTLIWYYYICPREVWYIGHSIEADQENDFLLLGKHIHEIFYKREKKEIFIDNTIKIDILSSKKIVGEIKKSSKYLKSAIMQVAFYLLYLKQKGIFLEGELLIPEERKKEKITLTQEIEKELFTAIKEIKNILNKDKPPKPLKIQYCKTCAYKEMCWS